MQWPCFFWRKKLCGYPDASSAGTFRVIATVMFLQSSKEAGMKPCGLFLICAIALFLGACASGVRTVKTAGPAGDGGPPAGSIDTSKIPDAVPKDEPRSRYGNPESYVVNGKRYYV